jgi:DNA-binding response OmpR family regulator
VPDSHLTSARSSDQPSIVVLEEYDALAAAITSALKKFAPKHVSRVARSLAEAEKLASDLGPELFIVDVDPAWNRITDFLDKIRSAHPDARALVIGAPIPPEIAAERGSFGALQFIEKPFELAAFGAAVQALLGPWRKAESESARGSLSALSAIDLVLLHFAAGASALIDVRSRARSGQIQITRGEVSHAATRKLQGVDALWEILTWRAPHFSEAKSSGSRRRGVPLDWRAIVVEALAEIAPSQQPIEALAKPPAQPGSKIVVVDDTEMLLIFVEDILARADPKLQITTALDATDGLAKIGRIIPDLVLLDYSLPDFNGDELCQRLLQDKRTAQVPVLMMSGHVAEMTAAAARLPNVVATIEKPFFSEALIDLVQRTLKGERRIKRAAEGPIPIAKPEGQVSPAKPVAKPTAEVPTAKPPVQTPTAPEPPPAIPRAPRTVPKRVSAEVEPQPVTGVGPMVRVTSANDALLGLYLEVVSMQLTQQFQMGAIRAKPISSTVSLHLSSAVRSTLPAEIGFQLGTSELEANGRLSILRLIPTAKPFQPAQTRNAFEIGGVSLIPNAVRTRVQLTPAGTTPMTMELLAHLELSAVELSPAFQVAQLILRMPTNVVRVTLNPKAPEQTAARFEITAVKLDSSARIADLLLSPIR